MSLLTLQKDILEKYEIFQKQVGKFIEFLKVKRTEESEKEIEKISSEKDFLYKNLDQGLQYIEVQLKRLDETKSQKTSSHKSKTSNASSVARQKRAQAEAAKTKLIYANKLAELKQQELNLQESAERRKIIF
jgi:uncharacterized protein (DUF2249 family)